MLAGIILYLTLLLLPFIHSFLFCLLGLCIELFTIYAQNSM
jgi:hypothetical protein